MTRPKATASPQSPTLRDQFAMAALAGGLGQGVRDNMDGGYWHHSSVIAKRAYQIADAMLAARVPPAKPGQ